MPLSVASGSRLSAAASSASLAAVAGPVSVSVVGASSLVSLSGAAAAIVVSPPLAALGAGTTAIVDLGAVAGTLALDAAAGNTVRATLEGDITGLSISGAQAGRSQRLVLYLTQGATGGHRLALPAGAVRWSDGSPLDLSAAPGAVDCLVLDLVAGTVFGNLVGTDYL